MGIAIIEDRVAQRGIRNRLESLVEPYFFEDSYSYRPNKSALDAVRTARDTDALRMKRKEYFNDI